MTGDRFAGEMEKGAMSFSHRLGVPFLSWCGRVKFGVKIQDWHCGIRGIRRDALEKIELKTDGMEFATEIIAEVSRKGLRTVRDGFRHLWFILRA